MDLQTEINHKKAEKAMRSFNLLCYKVFGSKDGRKLIRQLKIKAADVDFSLNSMECAALDVAQYQGKRQLLKIIEFSMLQHVNTVESETIGEGTK